MVRNRMTGLRWAAAAAVACALSPDVGAAEDEAALYEYGAYLARQCSSCHLQSTATSPKRSGLPDIWALPYEEFAERFTKEKRRSENATARMIAESFTEEEVVALLFYFSELERKAEAGDGAS